MADRGIASFKCTFAGRPCDQIFSNFDSWFEHSQMHFHGKGPPKEALCAFFCGRSFQNWRQRMQHVYEEHLRQGHTLPAAKIDNELWRHLLKVEDIGYGRFCDICKGHAYPSPPNSPVATKYDPGREKRQQRPRGGGRSRGGGSQ